MSSFRPRLEAVGLQGESTLKGAGAMTARSLTMSARLLAFFRSVFRRPRRVRAPGALAAAPG